MKAKTMSEVIRQPVSTTQISAVMLRSENTETSSTDVSDSQLFLIDKVEVRKDFLEIKFQISGTRRHGNKVSSFQQDMIKTFPARELKTLWIWVAVVTHINIQNRAGEDWLRNETRFFARTREN